MIDRILAVLWTDPQAQVPRWFCEKCGGECYGPGILCTDCEEKQ